MRIITVKVRIIPTGQFGSGKRNISWKSAASLAWGIFEMKLKSKALTALRVIQIFEELFIKIDTEKTSIN